MKKHHKYIYRNSIIILSFMICHTVCADLVNEDEKQELIIKKNKSFEKDAQHPQSSNEPKNKEKETEKDKAKEKKDLSKSGHQSTGGKGGDKKKYPVHFSGDVLEAKDAEGIVEIKKNVFVKRDVIEIRSEFGRLISNKDKSDIKEVLAKGKVSIVRHTPEEPLQAFGDQMVYLPADGIVTVTGNAEVKKNGDRVTGEKIIIDVISGKIKVEKVNGSMTE